MVSQFRFYVYLLGTCLNLKLTKIVFKINECYVPALNALKSGRIINDIEFKKLRQRYQNLKLELAKSLTLKTHHLDHAMYATFQGLTHHKLVYE